MKTPTPSVQWNRGAITMAVDRDEDSGEIVLDFADPERTVVVDAGLLNELRFRCKRTNG